MNPIFWIHPTTLTIINLSEVTYTMPSRWEGSEEGDVEVRFKNGEALFLYEKDGEPKSFFTALTKYCLKP
jgi:hypothetical protein